MSLQQSTRRHDAGRIAGPWNCATLCELKLFWSLPNGKIMQNTLHGHYTTPPSSMQTTATALFGSCSSAWGTNLAPYMHTQTIFTQVTLRDMASFSNPVFIGTGTAVPGTGTGAALPENVAIVLTENVTARGRGLKGRQYLGGWVQSPDVTTGGISTVVQTAINAYGTALINALNGQGMTAAVAQAPRAAYLGFTGASHPARGSAGNGTFVAVSSYTCRDLVFDTQRRRVQV